MTDGGGGAPALVLGPLLRYTGETEATIWVETDRPCQVAILGRQAPTFGVAGHHYALVVIEGLRPGTVHEYQVALDGVVRWPSFTDFGQLLAGLAAGTHGPAPASVTVISGDIPHSYLAEVDLPASGHPRSAVYQVVCSPIHNALPRSFRVGQEVVTSPAGSVIGTALARLAGVSRPLIGWRITRGPWFGNMPAALEFGGRRTRVSFARPAGPADLQPVSETELA